METKNFIIPVVEFLENLKPILAELTVVVESYNVPDSVPLAADAPLT